MKQLTLIIFAFLSINYARSQEKESPYQTDLLKDGIWITTGLGLNAVGVIMIQNKAGLTEAEVLALDKKDIWKIDQWAAGYYSKNEDELSYLPFYASFALPIAFLPSDAERNNFGQISVLYLETMATVGAMFTITAGAVHKSRPLVYNESLSMRERRDNDAQRSFFGGHVAATSAATFFTAKVFQDFNPNSRAIPYVWTSAVAIPAFVGYLRTKSGKHFLTDNLIGFCVGAATGILVPEIHKKSNENLNLYPTAAFNIHGTGLNSRGLALSYTF
ncbi:phosphatase PAP2 family protein [Salegentibacter sediminis]|uniref:phosphatase PAP2 family protein n=1 Tax=Salegentibacter sediminis TaxID=1930251 RepID=UPI0009BFCFE5|nr:phosphatase PAP2 family protein [Salegentibacter sediminis]